MTELDSEGVVSVWWSICIAVVLIVLTICWTTIAITPAARCTSACGLDGVARVTSSECTCREGL